AAAPLSLASAALCQAAQTPAPVAASMASDGFRTAWLVWHSTHPLSKICAWTLVWNFVAKTAWQVPHTLATAPTPGGVAPWLPWQSLHVGADRSFPLVSAVKCTLFW